MTQQAPPQAPPQGAPTEGTPNAGSGTGKIGAALTRKLGPLPAWGWGLVLGGGLLLWKMVHPNASSQAGQASVTTQVPATGNLPADTASADTNAFSVALKTLQDAVGALQDKIAGITPPAPIPGNWGVCGPMPLYVQPTGTQRICIPGVGWKDVPLGGTNPPPVSAKPPLTYTVTKGDTLSAIAGKFHLSNWQDLYQRNKGVVGANPNLIYPGQVLTIH